MKSDFDHEKLNDFLSDLWEYARIKSPDFIPARSMSVMVDKTRPPTLILNLEFALNETDILTGDIPATQDIKDIRFEVVK